MKKLRLFPFVYFIFTLIIFLLITIGNSLLSGIGKYMVEVGNLLPVVFEFLSIYYIFCLYRNYEDIGIQDIIRLSIYFIAADIIDLLIFYIGGFALSDTVFNVYIESSIIVLLTNIIVCVGIKRNRA